MTKKKEGKWPVPGRHSWHGLQKNTSTIMPENTALTEPRAAYQDDNSVSKHHQAVWLQHDPKQLEQKVPAHRGHSALYSG